MIIKAIILKTNMESTISELIDKQEKWYMNNIEAMQEIINGIQKNLNILFNFIPPFLRYKGYLVILYEYT
ncbi:MAG: hypothetical protein K0R72_691 [Clostridia bacterium]|jgi:hypothetical protein|nr:hypothetical protein [Clostridia bacterium]